MDEETAALVLDTIDMHYQAGCETLTGAQLQDHKSIGVCPACSDGIDYLAALEARALVTT